MSESARQRLMLRKALEEAVEGMEDMIAYVPEYFREKWDHQGYINRAKEALTLDGEA